VHFRSKELAESRPFGRFWHMFSPKHGYLIDQEEGEIFTAHMGLDEDEDISKIDPNEWVYRVLGGVGEPYRFKIDEVLVTSTWRINFAIAEKYVSSGGRVLLGGDACKKSNNLAERLTNLPSFRSSKPATWWLWLVSVS
jgi:hypothetical protein